MSNYASSAASRYQSVQVTTCTPGELVVMLYDGLLRFLEDARVALLKRDRARAGERISRSHAILEQLLGGLRRDVAPELYDQLAPLYMFCMSRLVEANIAQDAARIADVSRILLPLRDAWREAVKQVAAAPR